MREIALAGASEVDYFREGIPVALSGATGENRYRGSERTNQLGVDNDFDAVNLWLEAKAWRSEETRRAYRREIYRLMLWSVSFAQKPLSGLTASDLVAYLKWFDKPCRHPSWPEEWELFRKARQSKRSDYKAYATTVCRGCFKYLVENGYLAGNPFTALPTPDRRRNTEQFRYLDTETLDWLMDYLDALESGLRTVTQRASYERLRFVMHFGLWSAGRREELVRASMGDIRQTDKGNWVWYVTGKGAKDDFVVIEEPGVDALVRYRRARGLPHYPGPEEAGVPLIADLKNEAYITPTMLHKIVTGFFRKAAAAFEQAGGRAAKARQIESASMHWLRHSYASMMVKERAHAEIVAKQMRHRDMNTTMRFYVDAEPDDRAEQVKRRG